MGDKASTPGRVSTLALAVAALFAGALGATADAVGGEGSCCHPALAAEAALSRDSLYQLEATFTDDTGRAVTLAELRGRPVVVTMFFASCGYACPLLVADLQVIRSQLPADVAARTAFVLVSFDVARDTPATLAHYRAERRLPADLTLLHGDDNAVRELAAVLGVKFRREADGSFSHSNLITVLNPAGEIVHQRTGLRGGLTEAAGAVVAAANPGAPKT